MKNIITIGLLFSIAIVLLVTACSGSSDDKKQVAGKEENKTIDPMQDKGIGPVESISLPGLIDQTMAVLGDTLFINKCTACHKIYKRKIGPPLVGVTKRRAPEWIMNMILNPDEMVMKNDAARKLLMEYIAPMANQSLEEHEARALLEYFRSIDADQTSLKEE
ncbi:MAG: cytochrome c [Candidatus Marinimicrobia bacterium]|nr:cytochrome c [Candidatus Neomarinimicrobiota bacterium]